MIDAAMIEYVWSTIQSGVVGNAVYDSLKSILGKGFVQIESNVKKNDRIIFEMVLKSILESNKQIFDSIRDMQNGANIQIQNHSGNGDNFGGDKIVNIYSREMKKSLKLDIIHGNEIILSSPGAKQIEGPSYLLSATNTGEEIILIRKLGAVFRDSLVGIIYTETDIPIGVTVNWQIPKSTSVIIETDEKINNMKVGYHRELDDNEVQRFFVEDHTGKRYWLDFTDVKPA